MSRSPRQSARPGRRSYVPEARRPAAGPTQRQLRAGELVRHALVEAFRVEDFADPVLAEISVTVTEVRMSPDLRHAVCFVTPLGGEHVPEVVAALNRASRLLRGRLGRMVDLKFTPDLKFIPDDSFDEAERMSRLFSDPKIRRDLESHEDDEDGAAPGDPDGA